MEISSQDPEVRLAAELPKSDVTVRAPERRAKREPSQTVGLADISWMALS
jgi:hypothetical protein